MTQSSTKRLTSLDALRGIAIFTMVCANMSTLLKDSHPLWFRLYGSFAAPIFVTLTGFFVALGRVQHRHELKHFIQRSAMILFTAAVIDMTCYGLVPFVQVDVLYLIGVATLIAFAVSLLSRASVMILMISVFALAEVARAHWGYSVAPLAYTLDGRLLGTAGPNATVLKHWLIDGWFPLFPWLGFALLGVVLAQTFIRRHQILHDNRWLFSGIALLGFGTALDYWFPSQALERYGYSELFYPPTTNYILLALGVVLILIRITAGAKNSGAWRLWIGLGRSSLFIYILHAIVIAHVLGNLFDPMPLGPYLATYLVFVAGLMAAAQGVEYLKRSKKPWTQSFLFKFYLGG